MSLKCLPCFLTFFLSFFLSFVQPLVCHLTFFANDNKHSCHLRLQTYVKWQQWQPWTKRPVQTQQRDSRNKFPKTKLQLSWALAAWTCWQPSSSSIVLFLSAQILSPHAQSWIISSISSTGSVCGRARRRLDRGRCRQSLRGGESQSPGQPGFLQRGR